MADKRTYGHVDGQPFYFNERLGKGGFARVIGITFTEESNQPKDRPFALKISSVPNYLAKEFGKESQLLNTLKIRNTLKTKGPFPYENAITKENAPAILMEHFPGKDLFENIVDKKQKLSNEEMIGAFTQASLALHDAHKKGVVHGDIKPENMLYHQDSKDLRVIDWGSAGPDGADQEKGFTPAYADPELIKLRRSDKKQDIFALGLTIIELDKQQEARPIPAQLQNKNFNWEVFYGQQASQATFNGDEHLGAIVNQTTKLNRLDRSDALDTLSYLAAFDEARTHMNDQDLNEIANHVVKQASDINKRSLRPLLSASAQGLQKSLPANHELMPNLKAVGELDQQFMRKQSLETQQELAPAPRLAR